MIKFLDILKESDDNIFIPRGSKEEKDKVLIRRTNDKIQEYVKNGSEGDLILRNSPIKFLPRNLTKVGGDLNLMHSQIEKLPDNFTVNGILDLDSCKNLQSLPNGLKVKGSLDLRDTNITFLPSDLEFGTNLKLMRSPIEKLPDNLIVNGDLWLDYCKNIQSLPNGLKVKDTLDLRNTNITFLPTDIQVGKNLILMYSQIEKLPDNFTVNGALDLDSCENLTSLPNGLKVKDGLDLQNTNITSLPSDLEVGGDLILKNTPIADMRSEDQIRYMVPGVKGNFKL